MYHVLCARSSCHLRTNEVKSDNFGPGIARSGETQHLAKYKPQDTTAKDKRKSGDSKSMVGQ